MGGMAGRPFMAPYSYPPVPMGAMPGNAAHMVPGSPIPSGSSLPALTPPETVQPVPAPKPTAGSAPALPKLPPLPGSGN